MSRMSTTVSLKAITQLPRARRSRGSVKPVSREADGAKRSGLTEPRTVGQSRGVMAAVQAPCCTSEMSQDDRGALVKERQEGGDRLPQFRIQSECALTSMNACSRRNLTLPLIESVQLPTRGGAVGD